MWTKQTNVDAKKGNRREIRERGGCVSYVRRLKIMRRRHNEASDLWAISHSSCASKVRRLTVKHGECEPA